MSESHDFFTDFLIAYEEALRALDVQALSLETGGYSRPVIDTAFRIVHTLKGDVSFHGITAVKSICVVIEEVFSELRRNETRYSDDTVRLLWSGISLLRLYFMDLQSGDGIKPHEKEEEAFWEVVGVFTEKEDVGPEEPPGRYKIAGIDITPEYVLIRSLLSKAESADGSHVEGDIVGVLKDFARKLSGAGIPDICEKVLSWCDDADMTVGDDGRLSDYLIRGLEELASAVAAHVVDCKTSVQTAEAARVDVPRAVYDLEKSFRVEDSKIGEILGCTQRFENLIAELRMLHADMLADSATLPMGRRLGAMVNTASDVMYDMFQQVTLLRFIDPSAFLEKNKLLVRALLHASKKSGTIEATAAVYMIERRHFEIFDDVCLHVLRNAVDHGIELPQDRIAAGKPETCLITVSMKELPDEVELRISDDGRGIDFEKVRQKARARGILDDESAATAKDAALSEILFSSGFSTTDMPTDLSGRGVGLDVVKKKVESAHGKIEVQSERGKGTTFIVRLPKTESRHG